MGYLNGGKDKILSVDFTTDNFHFSLVLKKKTPLIRAVAFRLLNPNAL
jgi:hypothetical protein